MNKFYLKENRLALLFLKKTKTKIQTTHDKVRYNDPFNNLEINEKQ